MILGYKGCLLDLCKTWRLLHSASIRHLLEGDPDKGVKLPTSNSSVTWAGTGAGAIFILFWVNIPWTSAGTRPCNGHPWIMKLRITKFLRPTRFISYLLEWCLNCVCYELFLGLILRTSLWFPWKWEYIQRSLCIKRLYTVIVVLTPLDSSYFISLIY